ncbi:MAG: cache domain-containing protein [Clostridiales bacterium]|nr:cache domain-containing protein [Clostridiales bacterium]
MKTSAKAIIQNWIYLLIIMIVGFFGVGLYILISGSKLTSEASQSFYEYNLQEKKMQLQTEILNRLDEIEYERNKLLSNEEKVLYNKVLDVYNLLANSEVGLTTDLELKREMAISVFDNIVKDDEDYLYFAIDTEGVLIRSGADAKYEGVNLYDNQDVEGNYYVRKIVSAKELDDGLYVDYYWPKVEDGEPIKKTSYCLYLPEFDLIIGTGIYHDDLQERLKDRIYNRLQVYYEDKENYVFVTEYDSTARVSVSSDFIGRKMSEFVSFDGKSIHNLFMKVIKEKGYGFQTYSYNKKNETILSEKISYVHDLEGWDAYIGMGFHVDDLNEEVNNYTVLFKEHYYNQALFVIIGLMLIAIIVFAIYQRGAYLQKLFLKQGDIIFENLFYLSNEAIVVVSKRGKLLYENNVAKELFNNQVSNYIESDGLKLPAADDSTYILRTEANRVYYITLREEVAAFKNTESSIYFINDITMQYKKSHVFEQMALNDELTGLLNRRALKENYEDYCYELKENENLVLGMLDIDKFKNINDTHGHAIGDEVLKLLGATFLERLRFRDSFYRYGGEEFIILLRNITLQQSKELLETLNKIFCERIESELGFACTFSCGLTFVDYNGKSEVLGNIIEKADNLMYKAKENGRNRIEI